MDILSIALMLGAAGVGGAVGAAAAAISAGARVQAAFDEFEAVFSSFFESREDHESLRVRSAFDSLRGSLSGLTRAFSRLRRALRIR